MTRTTLEMRANVIRGQLQVAVDGDSGLIPLSRPVDDRDLCALLQAQRELERLITRVAEHIATREPEVPVRDLAPDGSTYDDVAADVARGDR